MRGLAAHILRAAESPNVLLSCDDTTITLHVPEERTKEERRSGYALRIDRSYGFLPTLWLCPDGEQGKEIFLPLGERIQLWRAFITLRRRIREHDVTQLTATLSHLASYAHTDNDIQGP